MISEPVWTPSEEKSTPLQHPGSNSCHPIHCQAPTIITGTKLYVIGIKYLLISAYNINVGKVAIAVKRLATGRTDRVRSRVSEGWRFFFTPSYPNCSWVPLSHLQNDYRDFALGERQASILPLPSAVAMPSWPVMGTPFYLYNINVLKMRIMIVLAFHLYSLVRRLTFK